MYPGLLLLAAVVVLYGWSSQIRSGPCATRSTATTRGVFESMPLLKHVESEVAWITDSDVCGLGKFAYVAWCVVLVAYVATPGTKKLAALLWVLLGATVFLSIAMNPPLAIRSIPAFLAIAATIAYCR